MLLNYRDWVCFPFFVLSFKAKQAASAGLQVGDVPGLTARAEGPGVPERKSPKREQNFKGIDEDGPKEEVT